MNNIGNNGFNNFGDYNKKNNNNIKKDCNKNVYKNKEKEKPLLSNNEADSYTPNVVKAGKKTTITVGIRSVGSETTENPQKTQEKPQKTSILDTVKNLFKKLF